MLIIKPDPRLIKTINVWLDYANQSVSASEAITIKTAIHTQLNQVSNGVMVLTKKFA